MTEVLLANAYIQGASDLLQGKIEGMLKVVVIPDNATNGDVIKSIYCQYGLVIRFRPRGEVVVDMTELKNNGMIPNMSFDEDWWNAPYKAEGEVQDADSD